MTPADTRYIDKLLQKGIIKSPCLELGVGYGGENNKNRIKAAGMAYFGSDMVTGPDVDFVIDFEDSAQVDRMLKQIPLFNTVLVLNVLEHTFDPIRILDNAFRCLNAGGACVIITPTVWPLHNFPFDTWRINPNFYEQYCLRRGLTLNESYFEYVTHAPVHDTLDRDGNYSLPKPAHGLALLWSRVVHKVFGTAGRNMFFPSHVATGVVITKPE